MDSFSSDNAEDKVALDGDAYSYSERANERNTMVKSEFFKPAFCNLREGI